MTSKQSTGGDFKPSFEIELIDNGFLVRMQGGITFVEKLSQAFSLISLKVEQYSKTMNSPND